MSETPSILSEPGDDDTRLARFLALESAIYYNDKSGMWDRPGTRRVLFVLEDSAWDFLPVYSWLMGLDVVTLQPLVVTPHAHVAHDIFDIIDSGMVRVPPRVIIEDDFDAFVTKNNKGFDACFWTTNKKPGPSTTKDARQLTTLLKDGSLAYYTCLAEPEFPEDLTNLIAKSSAYVAGLPDDNKLARLDTKTLLELHKNAFGDDALFRDAILEFGPGGKFADPHKAGAASRLLLQTVQFNLRRLEWLLKEPHANFAAGLTLGPNASGALDISRAMRAGGRIALDLRVYRPVMLEKHQKFIQRFSKASSPTWRTIVYEESFRALHNKAAILMDSDEEDKYFTDEVVGAMCSFTPSEMAAVRRAVETGTYEKEKSKWMSSYSIAFDLTTSVEPLLGPSRKSG